MGLFYTYKDSYYKLKYKIVRFEYLEKLWILFIIVSCVKCYVFF